MDLARQEYPAMLESLQPPQAVALLNDRIKHVSRLNADIADWLQERRRVEEQYALGLRKLSRRQPPDDSSDLGTFTTPWQKIITATETMAESHFLLAKKIEADVERSLRDFSSANREMQNFTNISGNLASLAKDVDISHKKAEKLKDKGGKVAADKVASANADMETAQGQWDSTAPFVFEKLQALDETRWNHLRDALTQFQTHEVDQVERSRISAEGCLNALLNVDTSDEIKTYCLRALEGKPKLERQKSRPSTTAGQPSLAPPRSQHGAGPEDGSSQRSGSTVQEQSMPARKGMSGLKRLGTVIGRKRQSTIYSSNTSTVPQERKSASNLHHSFSPFSRRNRDKAPIPEEPSPSLPSHEPEPPPSRQEMTTSPVLSEKPNGEPNLPHVTSPTVNGTQPDSTSPLQAPVQPEAISLPELPRDADGFSVPPSSADPISQAEQEAAASSDVHGSQFMLAIRNAPIPEEEADAATALSSVQNALLAGAPSRKTGTIRGRRDVRNTIYVPSPTLETQNTEPLQLGPASAPLSPDQGSQVSHPSPLKHSQRQGLGDDLAASDTQSVRSGRSLASSASATIKHPEMHGPGLNTSVVETVNAWFEKGEVTKAHVIGELALAFNPTDINAPFGTDTIRLDNFPALEKVAPNPTFVEQITDKPGTYVVDLAKIIKTSVAFKYQVHLDSDSLAAYAPLLIVPASRVETSQTDVILNCTPNPVFAGGSIPSVTLSNVLIIVHFDTSAARPDSCKLQPPGNFNRERNLAYWRLNDVILAPGTQRKLRMRLTGDGVVKVGNVEARWEIVGRNAANVGSGLGVSMLGEIGAAGATDGADDHDPFADEENEAEEKKQKLRWTAVEAVRGFRSGTYVSS
ncbi:hypothetical protein P152DRAFT_461918 [Eremomyces bilateralis CBS 781.70]|uniref:FCH domain-containing protein n=1 Tax=Eremomyces bilateralis CBS 781.70 TaxID=1392243 RepID=A0A6G1FTM1_9PEZI|nr:uncharacterized protein P152DRAFT_461918 [Eremomyces bilateralis CBS 781.70]KAF1809058.1 hypothetical protein P152DRAFT_461918 [Eremomyces bilateralis CBS 781.70]